jgi:hypothetical protein
MLVRRLALAIGFLFALIGVQGPEFAQQYRQRLAGAIDELQRVVAEFDAEAARQSLSPEQAVTRLQTNADPLARERGDAAAANQSRLARLRQAFADMRDGPSVARLWTFVADFDPETASRTLADYEPAAPTTSEAFIVAAVTGALGWMLTHLTAWPVRRSLQRRRGKLDARPPALRPPAAEEA